MPRMSNREPVDFKTVAEKLDSLLKFIDRFQHGEVLSKNQARKMLRNYRKELRDLSKVLVGARVHSLLEERKLVSTVVLENENSDVVLNETERKLEMPE